MDLEEDYNLYDDLTNIPSTYKRASIDSLIGTGINKNQLNNKFELENLDESFTSLGEEDSRKDKKEIIESLQSNHATIAPVIPTIELPKRLQPFNAPPINLSPDRYKCIVYVSNLQWFTTDLQIEMIFTTIAKIKLYKIITDKKSGKSLGRVFIEYFEISNVKECIEKLNGAEVNGKIISVVKAEANMLPIILQEFHPYQYNPRPALPVLPLKVVPVAKPTSKSDTSKPKEKETVKPKESSSSRRSPIIRDKRERSRSRDRRRSREKSNRSRDRSRDRRDRDRSRDRNSSSRK